MLNFFKTCPICKDDKEFSIIVNTHNVSYKVCKVLYNNKNNFYNIKNHLIINNDDNAIKFEQLIVDNYVLIFKENELSINLLDDFRSKTFYCNSNITFDVLNGADKIKTFIKNYEILG